MAADPQDAPLYGFLREYVKARDVAAARCDPDYERRGKVLRRSGVGDGEAPGPGARQLALPRQASSTRLTRAVRSSLRITQQATPSMAT